MLAPVCLQLGVARGMWMDLMTWTLERAGPAFIKWGQWSATRPDLFPVDLCRSVLLGGYIHHNVLNGEKTGSTFPCY